MLNSNEYSQPDFYKFSESSVQFSHWVVSKEASYSKKNINILDAFAGCGIVGIECIKNLNFLSKVQTVHFIEKERAFNRHILKNLSYDIKNLSIENFIIDFFSHQKNQFYDVIMMNPPFFFNK